MTIHKLNKFKYLFGVFVFLSALIFNLSYVQASYSAGTLVSMTNNVRAENGLGALSTNSALASAAYAKANDMLANNYFAHNSPDGKTPWDFIIDAGYSYTYAGENLAIGYTDASELFSAWMNSATHRQNILNSNFREIGIAVVSGQFEGVETIVVVQEFGAATSDSANITPSEQVASEEAKPEENLNQPTAAPEKTALLNQANQQVNFQFIQDKTEFSPKTIFSGEQVTFKVTLIGEVSALEAQLFDQKYNLLETGSLSGAEEKTFTLKQKIEAEGLSEVKIFGTDKAGNTQTLSLGNLEAKKTVIVNEPISNQTRLVGGFRNHLINHWLTYTIIIGFITLAIVGYFSLRKNKAEGLITNWKI